MSVHDPVDECPSWHLTCSSVATPFPSFDNDPAAAASSAAVVDLSATARPEPRPTHHSPATAQLVSRAVPAITAACMRPSVEDLAAAAHGVSWVVRSITTRLLSSRQGGHYPCIRHCQKHGSDQEKCCCGFHFATTATCPTWTFIGAITSIIQMWFGKANSYSH